MGAPGEHDRIEDASDADPWRSPHARGLRAATRAFLSDFIVSAISVIVAGLCVVAFSNRSDLVSAAIPVVVAVGLFRVAQQIEAKLTDSAPAALTMRVSNAGLRRHANPGWILGVVVGGVLAAIVVGRWV